MANQALLLIHGMGEFTKSTQSDDGNSVLGSFGHEFMEASTEALQRYENHETETLADHADISEFNYDNWFEEIRKEMANRAKGMQDRLGAIAGMYGVSFKTELAGKLTALEADFGDDDFFHTHFLDVIFYTTMLGAKIRVDAGEKIARLVEEYGQGNVHIVAHSLGTAVLHDTLHLLYRPESDPNDEIPDLHLTNHKLGSLWMFANVSRLVNAFTDLSDPMKSVVKPGDDGCTLSFFNIRHKLDPFTWLSRFDPRPNGSWISEKLYATAYNNIVTDLIVDGNTHSFSQYIQDPKVAEQFLYRMTPFNVTIDEMNKVSAAYAKKSINGAYAALEDAFRQMSLKDIDSLREV